MAGLGGLASFIQYQGQLQQQEQAKQQQQMQLQAFQQAQQDRQRQQAAMAAAGNALPQLLAGGQVAAQPQMPPPPQPPAPGQASQPAQQPMPQAGGGVPLPPGQPGQMPPAGRPPLPPFRPMPTTPPQAVAPQGAIPAPPQPAQAAQGAPRGQPPVQLSLDGAIKVLKDQGLSGADLMAGLGQLMPLLDTQAKQQAAIAQQQFNDQIRLLTLRNQESSTQERIEHDRALETAAQGRLGVSQGNLDVRREKAGRGGGAGAGGVAAPPEDNGRVGTDGLPAPVGGGGLSGGAVRLLATRVKSGDPTALTGQSRAARAAVMNDLAKLDSAGGADIAGNQVDFRAAQAGARTATQREANISTSEKAIINPGGLADQVLDAARKTYRTGSPFLNQKINYVLANYQGDPAVVDLKNALGDLEGQFNKAMAGGGAATDSARAETIARINDAQTLPQLEAAINRMKLGLQKEGEAAQETSKMFADRVRQAGKVSNKAPQPASGGPAVGTVESGYRFKGGDPSSANSWERVQ